MIFDPCKQVRLDAANLPDHLADLTSGRGGLGIVVCVGEVIAQITDLIEAALYCGGRHRAQVLDLRLQWGGYVVVKDGNRVADVSAKVR